MTDYNRNHDSLPQRTAITITNHATASQYCLNRLLHAQDVHAGNLLVLEDGRVAFIDFGIVGRFSPDTWTGVSRLADGVAEEDFKVMAEVRMTTRMRTKRLCCAFRLGS